jgi:hypothetical protein
MTNKHHKLPIVITTINRATEGVIKFLHVLNSDCIIIGDRKTPHQTEYGVRVKSFIAYQDQKSMNYSIEKYLPVDHYSRKNIGYLYAMRSGSKTIAETDDDNIPYDDWDSTIEKLNQSSFETISSQKYFNAYCHFSELRIWPRGYPLTLLQDERKIESHFQTDLNIMVVQGLADKNPDVDAIYRLLFPHKDIKFNQTAGDLALDSGVYCPFNSQNTVWKEDAFAYLYLPITVSFRFTDILRGYVAQRGLWAIGGRLLFTAPTVYQERNDHSLLKDFKSEIDCYLRIEELVELLDQCTLTGDPFVDIVIMYSALLHAQFVSEQEILSIKAWVYDVKKILGISNAAIK